jgi:hypothetical protein
MRRREFIRLFSSTVVVWPLGARAKQLAPPTVGFLRSSTLADVPDWITAKRTTDGGSVGSPLPRREP